MHDTTEMTIWTAPEAVEPVVLLINGSGLGVSLLAIFFIFSAIIAFGGE